MSGGSAFSQLIGGKTPAQGQGGAGYSAPAPMNPYRSAFGSQQNTTASQQLTPFAQQMQQQAQNPYQEAAGLQAAIMQMMGGYNQPMMRSQMPQYQNPALSYRPNLEGAMQGLNRVAPSVELQQRQAAEEAARLAAEEAARAPQEPYYGGGG